jgi:hypothetical protein
MSRGTLMKSLLNFKMIRAKGNCNKATGRVLSMLKSLRFSMKLYRINSKTLSKVGLVTTDSLLRNK